MRSQFDQRLFVRRVRKAAHVHFRAKVLEFIPSFDDGAKGCETDHDETVFPYGPDYHTHGHD